MRSDFSSNNNNNPKRVKSIRTSSRVPLCDVCVFFPFILDVRLVGRTSRGHTGVRSHRISPPFFCGAYLYLSREKDSAIFFSLVDREVDFVY